MSNLNGHYNVHDVIVNNAGHGEKIQGKLSDFKGELRHLWQDAAAKIPSPKTKTNKQPSYRKYVIHDKDLDCNPDYIVLHDVINWIKKNRGFDVQKPQISNWVVRGVITIHRREGVRGRFLEIAELEKLVFDENGCLLKKYIPRGRSLPYVAKQLNVDYTELVQAVERGDIKTRQYGSNMVYYFEDVLRFFGKNT